MVSQQEVTKLTLLQKYFENNKSKPIGKLIAKLFEIKIDVKCT